MKVNLKCFEVVAGAIILHRADEIGMFALQETVAMDMRMASHLFAAQMPAGLNHFQALELWRQFPPALKRAILARWKHEVLPVYRN